MRFFQPTYCSFLWNKCLERSTYFTLSPHYHSSANTKVFKYYDYDFGKTALLLINDYLTNRLQRVKIGSTFSFYLEILRGIKQGSMLIPILFNHFTNDLVFHQWNRILWFCRDATKYSCSLNYEESNQKLSNNIHTVLNWFKINSMVANAGKFQVMFLSHQCITVTMHLKKTIKRK